MTFEEEELEIYYLNNSIPPPPGGNVTQMTKHADRSGMLALYWPLLVVGVLPNLVLLALRARHRLPYMDQMIMHMAISNIFIMLGMIPSKIWKYESGKSPVTNEICELLLFLGDLGFNMCSNLHICNAFVRLFDVSYKLKLSVTQPRRGINMIFCAWAFAIVCAVIPSIAIRLNCKAEDFVDCFSFERNVGWRSAGFFVPLLIIIFIYVSICCKVQRNNKKNENSRMSDTERGLSYWPCLRPCLRRSNITVLERAYYFELRLTVSIVLVFVICWLPYSITALWSAIFSESASQESSTIRDYWFVELGMLHSCSTPIVYGYCTLNPRVTLLRLVTYACCISDEETMDWNDRDTYNSCWTDKKNNDIEMVVMKPNEIGREDTLARIGHRLSETSPDSSPLQFPTPLPTPPPPPRPRNMYVFVISENI